MSEGQSTRVRWADESHWFPLLLEHLGCFYSTKTGHFSRWFCAEDKTSHMEQMSHNYQSRPPALLLLQTHHKQQVSQVSRPSRQTAVPLWWRIWTGQRARRRSPPPCCWAACTAVRRPRRCKTPSGRRGRPRRRGPLWGRRKTVSIRPTPVEQDFQVRHMFLVRFVRNFTGRTLLITVGSNLVERCEMSLQSPD